MDISEEKELLVDENKSFMDLPFEEGERITIKINGVSSHISFKQRSVGRSIAETILDAVNDAIQTGVISSRDLEHLGKLYGSTAGLEGFILDDLMKNPDRIQIGTPRLKDGAIQDLFDNDLVLTVYKSYVGSVIEYIKPGEYCSYTEWTNAIASNDPARFSRESDGFYVNGRVVMVGKKNVRLGNLLDIVWDAYKEEHSITSDIGSYTEA